MFSFYEAILLPLPAVYNLTRLIFYKCMTARMQTQDLPKHLHFILNTNQIKLYTYFKLLKENNLNLDGYY